jgi:hypothetical protein
MNCPSAIADPEFVPNQSHEIAPVNILLYIKRKFVYVGLNPNPSKPAINPKTSQHRGRLRSSWDVYYLIVCAIQLLENMCMKRGGNIT